MILVGSAALRWGSVLEAAHKGMRRRMLRLGSAVCTVSCDMVSALPHGHGTGFTRVFRPRDSG